jgi:hypothetical protein
MVQASVWLRLEPVTVCFLARSLLSRLRSMLIEPTDDVQNFRDMMNGL